MSKLANHLTMQYGIQVEVERSAIGRSTHFIAKLKPTHEVTSIVRDIAVEDSIIDVVGETFRNMSRTLRGLEVLSLLAHDVEPVIDSNSEQFMLDNRERIADRLAVLLLRFCDEEMSERVGQQLLARVPRLSK